MVGRKQADLSAKLLSAGQISADVLARPESRKHVADDELSARILLVLNSPSDSCRLIPAFCFLLASARLVDRDCFLPGRKQSTDEARGKKHAEQISEDFQRSWACNLISACKKRGEYTRSLSVSSHVRSAPKIDPDFELTRHQRVFAVCFLLSLISAISSSALASRSKPSTPPGYRKFL